MKILFVLIFLLCSINNIYADGYIVSFDEAQKLSQKTRQPVLAIFGSENCTFCKSLVSDVSNDKLSPEIDNYIICYVDTAKNKEYKTKYKINAVPDSRILFNNKEMSKNVGYTRLKYKEWLKNVHK